MINIIIVIAFCQQFVSMFLMYVKLYVKKIGET